MANPDLKTAGQHKGEFIVGLPTSISFDAATFETGHGTVEDGTIMVKSGAKVKPASAVGASDGTMDEVFAGISYGRYNTANGDVAGAVVARLLEVNGSLLTYPESADPDVATAIDAALLAKFIIKR